MNSNQKIIKWPELKACLYKRRWWVYNGRLLRILFLFSTVVSFRHIDCPQNLI